MARNMENIEHLDHQDAITKMKALGENAGTCFFATQLSEIPLRTRPMATQEVDDEGNFWFLSGDESNKNIEIESDSRVQLFYANPPKLEFMTVYGHAMIYHDREKIEQHWSPMVKSWFKDGKNDPSLSVILVIPDEAYYWDTKSNKFISLIKTLASAISEKTDDDGREGKLKIH